MQNNPFHTEPRAARIPKSHSYARGPVNGGVLLGILRQILVDGPFLLETPVDCSPVPSSLCIQGIDMLKRGPGNRSISQRVGVSITEVMVVLGIHCASAGHQHSSGQYSREAARRTQCQNNQRQILLACQAFEATNGSLPSLYNGTSLAYPLQEWDLFHMHSWRVELLPYLEQQPLRDKIDWSAMATDPVNQSVLEAVVPVYVCPSEQIQYRTRVGERHTQNGQISQFRLREQSILQLGATTMRWREFSCFPLQKAIL